MCIPCYDYSNDYIELIITNSPGFFRAKKCKVKRYYRHYIGGDEESRTPDPLLARQMLYQLSYTPTYNIDYN